MPPGRLSCGPRPHPQPATLLGPLTRTQCLLCAGLDSGHGGLLGTGCAGPPPNVHILKPNLQCLYLEIRPVWKESRLRWFLRVGSDPAGPSSCKKSAQRVRPASSTCPPPGGEGTAAHAEGTEVSEQDPPPQHLVYGPGSFQNVRDVRPSGSVWHWVLAA